MQGSVTFLVGHVDITNLGLEQQGLGTLKDRAKKGKQEGEGGLGRCWMLEIETWNTACILWLLEGAHFL